MALRSEEIEKLKFSTRRRGYDKGEVDKFMTVVADSTRELEGIIAGAKPSDTERSESAAGSSTAAVTEIDPLQAPSFADASSEASPEASNALSSDSLAGDRTADMEQAIIDRYGALGDRIAELLRSADDSADQLRAQAEADASATREHAEAEAAQMLAEAKAMREEADVYKAEITAEVDEMRAAALAEIDELKSEALSAAEMLRSEAKEEAQRLHDNAIAEGSAVLDARRSEIEALETQASEDRDTARSELAEVRSQVGEFLEQARAQSEFIKQEAEEIIRTKVRANMDSAQSRIDILRNTETVSRERIVLAQKELASALSRLESDDAPQLEATTADEVLEEATQRILEAGPAAQTGADLDGVDADVLDADVLEGEVVEADVDPTESVDDAAASVEGADDHEADTDEGLDPRSLFGLDDEEEASDDAAVAGVFGVEVPSSAPFPGEGLEHDASVAETVPESDETPSYLRQEFASADNASMTSPLEDEGSHEEEDALARLVREAMQEAVDSARKAD